MDKWISNVLNDLQEKIGNVNINFFEINISECEIYYFYNDYYDGKYVIKNKNISDLEMEMLFQEMVRLGYRCYIV